MRNEKEKLFCSLSAPKSFDFDCLPVTLNLYFSMRLCASFQSLKHFSLLSVEIDGKFSATFRVIPRWWSTTSHAKFTCAPLISSLFILLLRSLKAAVSMANRFVEILLLLFFNIFPFFCSQISRSSPLKWQKIMHPSGLHFNGTFQFSLRRRRRRFASNHHPKPIAWAAEKGTRLVERHKSGKSYCFRLISEVSISLCSWWLLVCLFWRGF